MIANRRLALVLGLYALAPAQSAETTITGTLRPIVSVAGAPGYPALAVVTATGVGPLILPDAKARDFDYLAGRSVVLTGVVSANLLERQIMRVTTYRVTATPTLADGQPGARLIYRGGGVDANGRFMGGTEMRVLSGFDGRLFAATGMWSDAPNGVDPTPAGPQVIVLDRPDGEWRVDREFAEFKSSNNLGLSFLEPVRFTRDGRGRRLAAPVDLLVAGGTGSNEVFARRTGDGGWAATGLAVKVGAVDRRNPSTRAAVNYTDPVTRTEYVFVGVNGAGIWKGVYDPPTGLVRWEDAPELKSDGPRGRILGLSVIDGSLYASLGEQVMRRTPGKSPTWTTIFAMSDPANKALQAGVRRASGLPHPGRATQDILVGYEGNRARAVLLDPANDFASHEVFALESVFPEAKYGLVDYDGAAVIGTGKDAVALFGLSVVHDGGGYFGLKPDAEIAWQAADGRSGHFALVDHSLPAMPPLVAARRILPSPFKDELGTVVYFSGMDMYGNPNHNTAWIMKMSVAAIRAAIASSAAPPR